MNFKTLLIASLFLAGGCPIPPLTTDTKTDIPTTTDDVTDTDTTTTTTEDTAG